MPTRNGPTGAGADPAVAAYTVTPSDSVYLANGPCRALYVGVTGDIALLVPQAGVDSASKETTVLVKAAPVGVLPIGCLRVNLTATTATNILALY